jgi:arginine/lysine/ornithine decarboxylase
MDVCKYKGGFALINNIPILEGLLNYINEDITPFHMPGHKNNKKGFKELEIIKDNLYKIDKTEVPGLDNLHMPEEMILRAQVMAAKAYRARESYFLVNGSTSGIYSMILGVTKPGDKIIVQRNCHRSVYMACLLGGLETVYVTPEVLEDFNIAASISSDNITKILEDNPEAKAVVLTYPSYYGTCSDLEKISHEVHKRGMLLLVDEAHGAHLPFNNRLPKSAVECGADISVVSLHKTTPALTQTSILNINGDFNTDGIRFMLRLFQSTSPSYAFMASIDAARYIMEENGEKLLDELLDNIKEFKNKIAGLSCYKVLDKLCIGNNSIHDIDETKLVIRSSIGGRKLEDILRRRYKIQVEMSDIYNITLICSVGDSKEDFDKLYSALDEISKEYVPINKEDVKILNTNYKIELNMKEAYYKPKKRIKLSEAEGKVSSEMAAPYPPGIPILLPGEIITREIIEHIELCKAYNIPLNGITDANADYINIVDI